MRRINWLLAFSSVLLLVGCPDGPVVLVDDTGSSDGTTTGLAGLDTSNTTGAEPDAEAAGDATTGGGGEDTTPDGDVPCIEKVGKACVDNTVYWIDSCGEPGIVFKICSAVCVDDHCEDVCNPKTLKKCQNGNVFWFDSCGQVEGVAQVCEEGTVCESGACIAPDYSGSWTVTTEPKTQVPPGGGDPVSWAMTTLGLAIDGETVTGTPDAPNGVMWTGTIAGDTINLTAAWTDEGVAQISHAATLTIGFTSTSLAYGTAVDTLTQQGNPSGKLVWNLTVVRTD